MIEWAGKRYWLVGASEGLGAALAHKMSAAGVHLILSARSEDKLNALAASLPGKSEVVTVDVSDTESVKAATAAVGDIDGIVQIAGVYWPFGANNWDADQAIAMADINFTGAMRLMGAVVPKFVERDAGHIVLTGSLSGFRGLPGAAAYTSSKAGVMTLAESLYADLHKTNVRVQLVNPGFVKTRLTDKNDFNMPFIMEPEDAAREFFEHMNTDAFKRSFPTLFSWVFRGSQFLPDWLYYRLFA
ncbi:MULTISPECIES: SDR family NAD(P)-dependent oxidoreductase [Marivita]|uniref:SDR family NAD(P)-dependent oxidoreductase n=1 Tax=Marivita cryptomonadis TaxID=505252 RepID=A0A9Q2RYG6_9RHOB|nr:MULTISPECIES: SDR family NAD(P)-dependent oxidoreductase [Marivita]MCR9166857.1 SDR family NAD(P)-dependent oxidoreductase [Paracoccaceae bacterium]MBM2323003.1 SDR family NAD(P)-dependent oxidoreductase [Marivita cryptomonadis]MBM2332445.1 SDR family NAD(P)-dependent oxidoreductase [Marivita cryptomonadis]MBM2342028.1 SDR family NAD(P)-dependent oxidoreductase [Marivita cryptomonadis]MBM2346833.1 SDR family NAD(P)-dependent oxidoreductase [Marivita cryptomonadis]